MLRLTPIVKNLLIINVVIFLLQSLVKAIDVSAIFALWNFGSENFAPYQFFTYMFAHGSFTHLLFNMFGLIFLGPLLEQFWGPKKFLTFYLITGIGAALVYSGIKGVELHNLKNAVSAYEANPDPERFNNFVEKYVGRPSQNLYNLINAYAAEPNNQQYRENSVHIARRVYDENLNLGRMVGASGAIYGILMAFGLLFPNLELMLIFPPIPIKAKYMVLILGVLAIYLGFQRNPGDNVAHFAHLGGMVFAYIMIRFWRIKGR